MGYRSNVRIIMSKNGYYQFQKDVKEHIDNYKSKYVSKDSIREQFGYDFNLLNQLHVYKRSIDDENLLYFGWNELKWYDGYEEVDAIMDSLNKLEDKGYGYSYSRMGEDYDDYEEKYVELTANDNIKYLEIPQLERYFTDDRFIDINLPKNKNERGER